MAESQADRKQTVKRWSDPGRHAVEEALENFAAGCLSTDVGSSPKGHPDLLRLKLYAASERLKLAIRQCDVPRALLEIGSNLIGCEQMAILEMQENSAVSLLVSFDLTESQIQALMSNTERIATEIRGGQITITGADSVCNELWSELGITAFVPVWYRGKPSGAIAFYKLLPQRDRFDASDRNLLQMLSIFSGPSLFKPGLSGRGPIYGS